RKRSPDKPKRPGTGPAVSSRDRPTLGFVRHRAEGVDLPVAVPGVMACAAGTDLRRAIANTDKRVVARWHSGGARLGIRGLAEVGLHGARRHLAVRRVVPIAGPADDQR